MAARRRPACQIEVTVTNLLDTAGVGGLVLNARDVTDRVALEVQLKRQAFIDPLTELPNRALFRDAPPGGPRPPVGVVVVAHRVLPRPRRVQGGQRHPRPQRGRRAAGRRRPAAAVRGARQRHGRPLRRRRVRRPHRRRARPGVRAAARPAHRRPPARPVRGRRRGGLRRGEHRHRRARRPGAGRRAAAAQRRPRHVRGQGRPPRQLERLPPGHARRPGRAASGSSPTCAARTRTGSSSSTTSRSST